MVYGIYLSMFSLDMFNVIFSLCVKQYFFLSKVVFPINCIVHLLIIKRNKAIKITAYENIHLKKTSVWQIAYDHRLLLNTGAPASMLLFSFPFFFFFLLFELTSMFSY